MREDGDRPDETAPPAPRGLAACDSCHAVVPAGRLVHAAGRAVCPRCARSAAPRDDAPVPPVPPARTSPARPSLPASTTFDGSSLGDKFRPRAFAGRQSSLDEILADPFAKPAAPAAPAAGEMPARPRLTSARTFAGQAGAMPPWASTPPDAPGADAAPAPQPPARGTSAAPAGPAARRAADVPAAPPPPRIERNAPAPWSPPAPARAPASPPTAPRAAPSAARAEPEPARRGAPLAAESRAPGAPAEIRGQVSRAAIPPWEMPDADDAPRARRRISSVDSEPAAPAPPPPSPRGALPGGTSIDAYAELRRLIDAGHDDLDTRRRAAETAARLGLHIEALEHYRRCVELDPSDERLRMTLDNVQRAVAGGAGGSAAAGAAADGGPPQRRVAEEARPFWEDLGGAISFPFRGVGVTVLLVGGILFGIGRLISEINLFGGLVTLMLSGYVAAYLFDVINSAGAGKEKPPDLPEATNVLESYVFPYFAFLGCALFSFAPFLLTILAAFRGWVPPAVAVVLGLATFAAGFFVMPMSLMVRAMFQSIGEAMNPRTVLGSIGRIFPDYVAMFMATTVLWVAYGIAAAVIYAACWAALGRPDASAVLQLDGARILSWSVFTVGTWPLFLYAWMVQGHLLGRLYRQGLRRLAWFVPPTDATVGARKLSAGLAWGAVLTLGLLCGAAWAAGSAVERMARGGDGAARDTDCPLGDGSSLVYFWENTDGAAGLTEYRFARQADGTLRVTAHVRTAGENAGTSDETVGIFDPDDGTFTDAAPVWGHGIQHEGRKGRHVAFYGPKKASVGTAYVNDWVAKEPVRWRGTWSTLRVHDDQSTSDRYYDVKSGILVGSSFKGVGFVVTEWLVSATKVAGAPAGIAPNRDFPPEEAPNPYDGAFDPGGDE